MNVTCSAEPCPVILNATCVFYEGNTLVYTGIVTNDNLQTALQKIDQKFQDSNLGYIFTNGIEQLAPGQPVMLGGALVKNTTIGGLYNLAFAGTVEASALITTGGSSTDFVKGDGSLDSTSYQPAGNYISNLTGDVIANGPGSVAATLATVFGAPGTYGNSGSVPAITVDGKGRITNVTPTPINYPAQSLSFIGDVSGLGFTGSPVTLTLDTVNTDVYGSNNFLKFAVNGKGLITSATPVSGGDITTVLGYVPVDNAIQLSINGTAHDLSASRSWNVGTVTAVSITAGTGLNASISNPNTTPSISIVNTAPDQTVVLNGGFGISVTGSYPNFTIINDYPDITGGTVTTFSAGNLSPLFTTSVTDPTTTPALSFALSSAAANTVFAGPNGGSGTPGFRALVAADLPSLSYISSISTTAPLATTGGLTPTLSISQAGASTDGYLSSTDWNTFNNKQPAGSYITALTGDGTASGPGSACLTLATVNSDVYASETLLNIAVNGKGLITSANPTTAGDICSTLGYTPEDVANKSTCTSLGVSNTLYPTQLAVKTYVDNATAGGIILQGDWNAATNTPDITGTTTTGWAWRVSVAGTTNLGGITDWQVGDLAVKSATGWVKIDNTENVTSVFGRFGTVIATTGDYLSCQVTECGNLYYTDVRVRAAVGHTAPLTYCSATGVFGITQSNTTTDGYLSSTDWNTFNNKQNALGYTPVNETRQLTINGTTYDLSADRTWNVGTVTSVTGSAPLSSSGGTTPNLTISQAGVASDGYLSSTDWNTFNSHTGCTGTVTSVGLTSSTTGVTIGSSPVTTSGNITLAIATASSTCTGLLTSADWNTFNSHTGCTGTVTCVNATGTNISVTGGPITTSGTLAISLSGANVCSALGYTPYSAANPDGYTTCVGTVTSVGIVATNINVCASPVTTSGNICLNLTGANVCAALGYSPAPTSSVVMVAGGGTCSTIRCGVGNSASSDFSAALSGSTNSTTGNGSVIVGGCSNTITVYNSFVGGGYLNRACGLGYNVVVGGYNNSASGNYYSAIVGGESHIASGRNAFVGGGQANTASGCKSTVGGGWNNTASGYLSTVSGGYNNTSSTQGSAVGGGQSNRACGGCAVVAGGSSNTASGTASAVVGGQQNTASLPCSAVVGGKNNTSSGTYAFIGAGVGNTSSNSATFVGSGYYNVASCGYSTTVGGQQNTASGRYSFAGGGLCNNASGDMSVVGGGSWNKIVSPTNTCCVTGATIAGGVGNNTTGGAFNAYGVPTVNPTVVTAGCYSTIGGGFQNKATGTYSTISGGCLNTSSALYSFVGGGGQNSATCRLSVVAGGYLNTASAERSTVAGGQSNAASGACSFVGGGQSNTSSGLWSISAGGRVNTASGSYYAFVGGGCGNVANGFNASTVAGGNTNSASNSFTFVGGGYLNTASGYASTVGGGRSNIASGACSVVGGGSCNCATTGGAGSLSGVYNWATGNNATIGGGNSNRATSDQTFVGGGLDNCATGIRSSALGGYLSKATGAYSTVAGGRSNTASGLYSFVGGGFNNSASGYASTIGGGIGNNASGDRSVIAGGWANTVSTARAAIAGGESNNVNGNYGFIGSGYLNTAGNFAIVGAGRANTASGSYSSIIGGISNVASGNCSTVGGGQSNIASGPWAAIAGGSSNTANGQRSAIGAGHANTASNNYSTVAGGYIGCASGYSSTVSGGYRNCATNDYSSAGGGYYNSATGYMSRVGGGRGNAASGCFAVIGGGCANTASGGYASVVVGGCANCATSTRTTVVGGNCNRATAASAFVGGGEFNAACGNFTTVAGGRSVTASGSYSAAGGGCNNSVIGGFGFIGGGAQNTVGGCAFFGTVSGGCFNSACGNRSTIAGGANNTASGNYSTVSGGNGNCTSVDFSTVGGGCNNRAFDAYSTVAGGMGNSACAGWSTVAGGFINTTTGSCSFIGGGYQNTISGGYGSFIGGGVSNCSNFSSLSSILGGRDNCNSYGCNTHIIGSCIAGNATNYTYVNNLCQIGGGISDRRTKNTICDTGYRLCDIVKLRPVSYCWNHDETNHKKYGFIAQEVQEAIPDIVSYNEIEKVGPDGKRTIFGEGDPVLQFEKEAIYASYVNAFKELNEENKALRAEIDDIKEILKRNNLL